MSANVVVLICIYAAIFLFIIVPCAWVSLTRDEYPHDELEGY